MSEKPVPKRPWRRMPIGSVRVDFPFPEASARRGAPSRAIRVGLLAPQSGPIGLFGPSSLNCAMMAADEVNSEGGILGRRVELVIGDGGGTPAEIVAETERMIEQDRVQAIVGSHISTNRLAMVEAIGGRIPYVYTTLYEGGQHSFGVFVCGETPEQTVRPLVVWLSRHRNARRWYLIGNDYVFPRKSIGLAKGYIAETLGGVVGEEYLPFFIDDFHPCIDRVKASGADAVLIYLVGEDGIVFNRQFAARGLQTTMVRAAPVLCENTLLGIGPRATRNLYSATGFTDCMRTGDVEAFRSRYRRAFGGSAPILNRFGLSCYDGLRLFAALAERAQSLNVYKLQAVSNGTSVRSPRGECRMTDNHLSAMMHVAEGAGVEFRPLEKIGVMTPATPKRSIWYPTNAGSA